MSRSRKLVWSITGAFVVVVPALLYAFSSGPDPRYTTAPGDDQLACATAGCHTGSRQGGPINAAGGSVTATFSTGSSYTPGTPLTITVKVADPVNTHFGFQMTARLDSNQLTGQAGDFTAGPGLIVLCDNGVPKGSKGCAANALVQFIEHNTPATAPWTFTWTPPATNVGPVHFYIAGNAVNFNTVEDAGDHVYTNSYVLTPAATVTCTTNAPIITRVNTASAFGGFSNFSAGSWLEIFGSNFTTSSSRIWGGADFDGANAPTSLDKVSVTINGKAAYTYYMQPDQINVEAPADTTLGNVAIVVTNCTQSSAPFMFSKVASAPGLLAPASFTIGGKQFLVAQFGDGTYVLNTNAIAGVASRPAKPGETITVYGIGFGDTNPAFGPGIIVDKLNALTAALKISFGSTAATTTYAGLAPGYVGLDQFNITVPNVADGDYPINVTLNGTALQQSLFLTVHK